MIRRLSVTVVLAVTLLAVTAATAAQAPANGSRWWASSSPFNVRAATDSTQPASATWARMLYDAAGDTGLWINSDAWTTTVYRATASTPQVPFHIANDGTQITIPYDPSWRASPDGDAHIAIIDATGRCDYEFQAFDPTHSTGWGESTYRLFDGSGAHTRTGAGHTGTNLSLLAGLIRPSDIRRGRILHALAFSAPVTGPTAVAPASASDGRMQGGIPEGTRFVLDPHLKIAKLHLTPFQQIVARALQQYGMYLRDTGGSVALYAESMTDGSTYALPIQPLPRDLLLHLLAVQSPRKVAFGGPTPPGCAPRR